MSCVWIPFCVAFEKHSFEYIKLLDKNHQQSKLLLFRSGSVFFSWEEVDFPTTYVDSSYFGGLNFLKQVGMLSNLVLRGQMAYFHRIFQTGRVSSSWIFLIISKAPHLSTFIHLPISHRCPGLDICRVSLFRVPVSRDLVTWRNIWGWTLATFQWQ